MPATRNQLLARLHCIKKERGWDDDAYRDILYARTGQRSAADLSGAELARAVAALGGQKAPGKPRNPNNEWAFIDAAAKEHQPLLRKICAVCRAMRVGRAYAEGVARRQHGGVERRLEMMSHGELWVLAGALSRTKDWGGPAKEADEMARRGRGG